jgi:hypothetical protein
MSRQNAQHFGRQGETTLSPQPILQNCMDAVLKWKSNNIAEEDKPRETAHVSDNAAKLFARQLNHKKQEAGYAWRDTR